MKNGVYGWTTGLLAVALCALVLTVSSPGAEAQANNGRGNNLAARVAALEVTVSRQQDEIHALATDLSSERQSRQDADEQLTGRINGLTTRVSDVEDKTQFMSVTGTTTWFSGTNVQVVNGMGGTHLINGLGNLIVGYNQGGGQRGGSHNIVLGALNEYTSYSGIVGGVQNRISGSFASVIGGQQNTASANTAVVTGGGSNRASHGLSVVSGGLGRSTTEAGQWIGGDFHTP